MKQFLSILVICMVTITAKSQNVFPTTTGSNVGIGTTTPGAPLEVNANGVGDSLLIVNLFAPNNTGAGNGSKVRFGALNTKGNSAEWTYVYRGYDSATNRVDFGFHSNPPVFTYQRNGNIGIWTTAPTHPLTLNSSASGLGIALYNTADQTTNYERAVLGWSGNQFTIANTKGGTGVVRDVAINANFFVSQTLTTTGLVQVNRSTSFSSAATLFGVSSTFAGSTTLQKGIGIFPTITQSSTAGYTALYISPRETSVGSGAKYLLDAGTNALANGAGTHTSMFSVTNTGNGYFAGNVGIGTNAPTAQLHTTGTVRLSALTVKDTATRILVSDTSGNLFYKNVASLNTGWKLTGDAGTNTSTNFIGTSDSAGLAIRTNNTTKLIVDASGNVGMGTIMPTAQLHTTGTVRLAGLAVKDTASRFLVSDTNGNVAYKNISSLNTGWKLTGDAGTNTSTNFIGTTDSAGLAIRTNNTVKLIVDASGKVGIGTTAPTAQLHASGTIRFSGLNIKDTLNRVLVSDTNGNVSYRNASSLNTGWQLTGNTGTNTTTNYIGTTDSVGLAIRTNNTVKLIVDGTGNVGIGTTTPIAQLTLAGIRTVAAMGSSGPAFDISSDVTDNTSSGTVPITVLSSIHTSIFTAKSPTTYTTAGILFLGAPTAGTNVTITNPYSLYASGAAYFGGTIKGNTNITSGGSVSATTGFLGTSLRSSGTNSVLNIQGTGVVVSGTGNLKHLTMLTGSSANTKTAGNYVALALEPTYNQTSGTAANTDFLINRTETAIGSGAQLLLDAQVGGISKFNINRTGQGYFAGNLGIGTNAPTAQLHATGTVRFSALTIKDTAERILVSDTSGNLFYRNVSSLNTGGSWGTITGTLASQTDLQNALNIKAPIASPAFSGIPTAPTAVANSNNSQIATTAYVDVTNASMVHKTGNEIINGVKTFADTVNGISLLLADSSLKLIPSEWVKKQGYIKGLGSFSTGAVPYANASGILTQDATGLNYDGNNLSVGHSGFGNTVGLFLNGGRASLSASGFGAIFKTEGGYPADPSKSIQFINSGTRYLKLGNSVATDPLAFYMETDVQIYPSATNFYSFGNATKRWLNVFSRNLFVDSFRYTNGVLGAGKVMTSDANGNASWQNASGSSVWTTAGSNIYYNTGNVGIGTNLVNDTAYKLFVEKGIRTRKIKVDAPSVLWADYVFDNDYKLPTLQEVEKFIRQNKHLPGVISRAEVEKNGIDLGDNQAILLKKVEELTLYMIELDKKVKQLSAENELLKSKINSNK